MAKRRTFDSTQALELILQDSSDYETEVDHYESSNKSVEDEDFLDDVPEILDDVPEINDDPDYLSNEDGEINSEIWPDTTDADDTATADFKLEDNQSTLRLMSMKKKTLQKMMMELSGWKIFRIFPRFPTSDHTPSVDCSTTCSKASTIPQPWMPTGSFSRMISWKE